MDKRETFLMAEIEVLVNLLQETPDDELISKTSLRARLENAVDELTELREGKKE